MHLLSPTHKVEEWQHNLSVFINSNLSTPFIWGKSDCCTFAANCIDAQWGTNILEQCLSRYNDKAGAVAVIKDAGSLGNLISQYLEPSEVKTLQRGDIVVFTTDSGDTTGMYLHRKVWSQGPDGIVWFNADEVEIHASWRGPKCHQQ